ncbi:MAG TPA: hypothetical protein PLZ13_16900, partial [Ottowia sp.]|nr:hypothetical protein [Ottowia sp.]
DRVHAVTGVAAARAFVSHTIQREFRGRSLRIVVQGLAWPRDDGRTLPLMAWHVAAVTLLAVGFVATGVSFRFGGIG